MTIEVTNCCRENIVSSYQVTVWETLVKLRSRSVLTAPLMSLWQHVELSQESTKSKLNGQHKAGLLPLSHSTHACVPFGHMDEVETTSAKLKSQEAFNLVSGKTYRSRATLSERIIHPAFLLMWKSQVDVLAIITSSLLVTKGRILLLSVIKYWF